MSRHVQNGSGGPARRYEGHRPAALAAILAAVGLPSTLAAAEQEPLPSLDPVVVVATRQSRPIREVAGSVTVVTRDELDATLSTSIEDAFRYVPGIDPARSGTRFGTEGLVLRGIGGNRVAMELDGVPISQHFAIGNFSNAVRDLVDVGQIQRIEVLQGPASALYGSQALGGVVAMQTPDPGDLLGGDETAGWGVAQGYDSATDGLRARGFVAVDGDIGGLGSVVWRQGHEPEAKAASRPDRQDSRSTSALAKLAWKAPSGGGLEGFYYGSRSQAQTRMYSILGTGRFATTTRLEGDDDYAADLLAATWTLAPGDWIDAGAVRAYHGRTDIRQDTVDERAAASRPVRIDRRFDYLQMTTGLAADFQRTAAWGTWNHRLGFGAEWTRSGVEESRDGLQTGLEDGVVSDTVLGETFPVRDFPESSIDELGAYLQDEFRVGVATVIAALRFDRYRLDPKPDSIYREDNPATTPVGISRDEVSPRLGVIVPLGGSLDGWMQYAHGFRGPSFEEANVGLDIPMFNIRAIPNPDLRPESSDGLEAGLRWRGGPLQLDFSAFYTRYEDFIEARARLGVDPESGRLLFQSRNIGAARIYGAQFDASADLGFALRGLSLLARGYWARGDNLDDEAPLNSVGPPEAVLGAAWRSAGSRTSVSLLVTLTARHDRLDERADPLFETPGHGVVDLFVTQRVGRLVMRAGLENLLDKTWWRWSDVQGLAPDDVLVASLSRPGRSVALEMGWNF